MPVLDAANNECVNAFKVRLIQFSEALWILLRGLNQQPFLLHRLYKRAGKAKSHGGKIQVRPVISLFFELQKNREITGLTWIFPLIHTERQRSPQTSR